ncbi:slr0666 [Synechocystis sp. PCC 6803]|jgi:hypothetical protein|uniref:Slr0666 protein n=1 Tax=Synechocystis sp. (strain ATCC 27184 / PCC 6803 / Kazusa) TaxID=1111708 RepID=P74583_SYNY3|nr:MULTISPECIES: hypothetical protein [unclassified Synechocystis]AGF53240.1 hypothetical protein MYO_130200 [Synechocystis sp. PCC 6803]ALJ69109.1 hypothetical protein AOY38_15490 [Synechocystis sp. PCC 6803]AVP90976.1 hypothetical protein C7I86_15630 [Synechocystis sp. IPPAS B-1465]MBD2618101.1 hypothetical protein [Synechocystis sp. FACHB-898]MBD2637612.1 hypothetical protein [Synechocystis sp. FACHB-908]
MDNATITAIATGLLVVVGIAQIGILTSQNRQTRLALVSEYWKRWHNSKDYWGRIIFVGRELDEYYQVLNQKELRELCDLLKEVRSDAPTIWALESIRVVSGILGDVSMRILQGQLDVSDAYPIFGTSLLRHSLPLRKLLDSSYQDRHFDPGISESHKEVRRELQHWLIYHNGLRRRCLILLDLLWAEAVRLEDLPPQDIESAAEAKKQTGSRNRSRLFREALRLNGLFRFFFAWQLSRFLLHAEYKSIWNWNGISKKRLKNLDSTWTKHLLQKYD